MTTEIQHLPLKNIDTDKLGFKEKAQEIADFINKTSPQLPYSVSINGSWGAGKSTMLNFIESKLEKGKCKVVRFNPWMISDSDELIKNLFEEIYFAMGEGAFKKAKDKFYAYAQKLIPSATKALTFAGAYVHGIPPAAATTVSTIAGDTVKVVSDSLFDEKPLSKRKQDLNNMLDETLREDEQKIVIMIDELDRLFPDEVVTVFQMIKSNLDLPGLFFVVAMDDEVIFDALSKKGISKPEYYLQKIFQRKYMISSKYQLMTLTDKFVLNNLNKDTLESEKTLEKCLKAYFYLEEKYYALNSVIKTNEYDSLTPPNGWIAVVNDDALIKESYLLVFDALMREINLHNPRTFLNFKELLLERWSDYYNHIFNNNKEKKIPCFIHTAFLIFIAHYFYPNFVEIKTFTETTHKNKEVPNFLNIISEHIHVITPYFEEDTNSPYDRGGKRLFPKSIIKTAILYLYKFPDDIKILDV
ncbi:hypothetical protein CO726_28085 [Bacillus fungorum]|uniref:KAP NTPase domain-containing protein n=1 Tax=Bacillus fungorum TaxID=2039284 RepID=A0A2G6Q6X5_9BACI|nr:P-loop NTPase fold protein [Bacillus fungorum]PIE92160.1 hypothetical protein CO726_28085 [Bacillus fungorum]